MRNAAIIAANVFAVAVVAIGPASAAEVKVLASNALKTVLEELMPQFEKTTEHKLAITYGSTGTLSASIEKGTPFDLTILGQLSPEIRSTGFRPDEIVIATGRPVLLVPYAGTFDTVGKRVLVAWDGTREAVGAR